MDKKLYNKYVEKWENYWRKEKEYQEKRAEYIRGNKEYLLEKLDRDYGKSECDFVGPYTIINDPRDLLNHNFILPGLDSSFTDLENTDLNIPSYFGKRLHSDLINISGIVIGYSYDAYDDYIQIRRDDDVIENILVNSHYTVEP